MLLEWMHMHTAYGDEQNYCNVKTIWFHFLCILCHMRMIPKCMNYALHSCASLKSSTLPLQYSSTRTMPHSFLIFLVVVTQLWYDANARACVKCTRTHMATCHIHSGTLIEGILLRRAIHRAQSNSEWIMMSVWLDLQQSSVRVLPRKSSPKFCVDCFVQSMCSLLTCVRVSCTHSCAVCQSAYLLFATESIGAALVNVTV